MNSTTDEANEGQRSELASQFLNTPTQEPEPASELEDQTPEENWLRDREQPVIVEQ